MANYTILLKSLVESGFTLTLNDYPIFDENYRNTLNQKILDHYYFYEIGFETPALFNFKLKTKLNEIMPYYNQLYLSQIKEFIPDTYKEVTEYKGQTIRDGQDSGNDTNSGNTDYISAEKNNTNKIFQFDTPQNILSLDDDSENHMSSASKTNTKSNAYTDKTTDNYTTTYGKKHVDTESFVNRIDEKSGYNQSQYKTLEEYRKSLLNIDMQIIDELRDLFMLVF